MFYGCHHLKKINFSNFDTESVTNMKSMFEDCTDLEKIDLSSFNTINVNIMEKMFYNCKNLKEIYGNFDCEQLQNSSHMLYNCIKLENCDIIQDYFPSENMLSMFNSCKNLKSIILYSNYEEKNMSFMFAGCENLESVYLEGFMGKHMNSLFYGYKKLKKVDLLLNENEELESMEEMYSNYQSLEIAYLYSIKNGANINNIFYNCCNLLCVFIIIDNLNNINIREAFKYCKKLKLIYILETIKESDIKKEFEKINIFP